MTLPVARTRDEARLYLDLTACACGALDADWQHATGLQDGELVSVYDATCPGCGADREYAFGLPERETAGDYPHFGGDEPSQLIDAGRWMALADQLASALPEDPATAAQALHLARAAVDEVIKFVPAGATTVPAKAFWTPEGRAVRDAEPGRFQLDRLEIVRNTYQPT
ncbi:hypothetical protein [Kribbella sp. HUAS MG21]|uniref:Uncharacterized protein n=1 Tax=Kribbella sp. HUAS MG21 TaxID=3160966 RepID=A0AAU7THJ5_9ACTN